MNALSRHATMPLLLASVLAFAGAGASVPAEGRPGVASISPPRAVRVSSVGPRLVVLRWSPVPGATGYRVIRGRTVIATVGGPTFRDRSVSPAASYDYRVRAVLGSGVETAASIRVPATTRVPARCDWLATMQGSDLASGRTNAPVRTVQRLVDLIGPGQIGCLRGSFTGDVTFHEPGTAVAPIMLRSQPGIRASVRGRMWIPDGARHVVVQDLDIDGRNLDDGELPSPTIQGDGSMLLHNDITNRSHYICIILGSIRGYGAARNVVIDSNRIHRCGRRPTNNEHHGIYVESAFGTRITNNVLWQNQSRGIQLYPNANGSYIARNVIVANGEGVIFSGNHGYASSNNRVVDNLIAHSRTRYDIEHWWPAGNPVGRGNLAARNCVWGGHDGTIIRPAVGFSARANIEERPRFRDLARGDLRAAAGSGCTWLLGGTAPLAPLR